MERWDYQQVHRFVVGRNRRDGNSRLEHADEVTNTTRYRYYKYQRVTVSETGEILGIPENAVPMGKLIPFGLDGWGCVCLIKPNANNSSGSSPTKRGNGKFRG